jgi:hypothetical protein
VWFFALVMAVLMFAVNDDARMGWWILGCVGAAYAMHLFALSSAYHLGAVPRCAALFYPIGSWHTGMILLRAARDLEARKPIRWGGKEYVLEPR